MKILKTLFSTVFLLLFLNIASAECAKLHFYRFNGFQSDATVYLYQDDQQIAEVRMGERYVANVCSNGKYTFHVRTNESSLSLEREIIDIQQGQNYYVKVSCAIGVGLSTIGLQNELRGKQDWKKSARFDGTEKSVSVNGNSGGSGNAVASQTSYSSNNSNSSGSTGGGGSFQRTQVMDNFKFEVKNVTRAGGLVVLDYKITNLAPDDRYLETCPNVIYFYDDLGNLVFAEKAKIANSEFGHPNYQKHYKVRPKYYCNGSSNAIMPSGIPLNAKITIPNVNNRATKFVRASMSFKAASPFELRYNNIEFPKVVDSGNPNQRNFGDQSLKLVDTQRNGNSVLVHYRHTNNSSQPYDFTVKQGVIYDDSGQQYEINAVSFINSSNPLTKRQAYGGWKNTVNSGSSLDYYVMIENVNTSASQIKRITLDFAQFELMWSDNQIRN